MVVAIKVLHDGFVRMEQMKREIESMLVEMDCTKMILDSRQRIVEYLVFTVEKSKVSSNHFFVGGLWVVAVDDDTTILEIIKQMGFKCHYRVATFSDAPDALNYVLENKDRIDVILVDVHLPNMDGYEFLKHINKEIDIPVIIMSVDGSTSAVRKAITHGACDYWTKPFSENQFKIMWKHVAMKAWNEKKLQKKDFSEFASSVLDANLKDQKEISSNSKESDVDDCDAQPKKPRIAWKGELHCQFVKAVMHIGLDKAQPKKILEVMNIPGLTKDHVASHLQKYRFDLKKSNEVAVQQNEMQLPNSIQSTEPIDWFNPEGWTSQPDESILESVSVQSQNQQQGGGSLHVLPPPLDGFRIQTDWCNMNF
ncbi:hypothetical protein AAZX31_19G044000 [Glycine max]|nr:hypothetical protein GYH30_052087 [Glycine max]